MVLFRASALMLLAAANGAAAQADDEIVTDRPDFVESSNVVGKGRVQLETSVAVERNRDAQFKERTLASPTLLRFGISDNLELRIETDGRLVYRLDDRALGTRQTERGYADTALGIKWHVQDEQGAMPSLGVLLHADLDSGSAAFRGHGVRPSLRVAAEWELPDEFALGVMPGIASDTDEDGKRYTSAIFGIVLGKSWTPRWRTFVEVSAPHIARVRHGGTQASVDVGTAYLLSKRCQIDTAFSRGLNDRTADFSWTVGFSIKL